MEKFGVVDAKKQLSKLVERASCGEQIGITRRGRLVALIVCARSDAAVQNIFDEIDRIRKRARQSKKMRVKHLIAEGREGWRTK